MLFRSLTYDYTIIGNKTDDIKKILNKEMIIWVAEACERALGKKLVYVATDDSRIHDKVRKFGFQTIHTSKFCLTGTDRVAEASKKINSKIYINVQGDEPLVKPQDIISILKAKIKYPDYVVCGYTGISINENLLNKNIPKSGELRGKDRKSVV